MKQLEKQMKFHEKEITLKDKNLQEMMESREKAINEMEILKQELKNRRNKTQEKVGSRFFFIKCLGGSSQSLN